MENISLESPGMDTLTNKIEELQSQIAAPGNNPIESSRLQGMVEALIFASGVMHSSDAIWKQRLIALRDDMVKDLMQIAGIGD